MKRRRIDGHQGARKTGERKYIWRPAPEALCRVVGIFFWISYLPVPPVASPAS